MSAGRKVWKILRKIFLIIIILAVVLAAAFLIYVMQYYHADDTAMEAVNSTDLVTVEEEKEYFFFDGPGENAAYIFYPGAKVETESYAPLMQQIAENGMDVFLVKMPFRLAVLGWERADDILDEQEKNYGRWYIGGHSLGGAMAASYASLHLEELDGCILMASYPTYSLEGDDFSVLSLYGSEDQVLDLENFEAGREYMPEDYTETEIAGGNHAQFGNYGEQKGDGTASITWEEQQNRTVQEIAVFISFRTC